MRITSSVLALAVGLVPALAQAEIVFGLTADDRIVTFDSATPGTVASSRAVTGLGGGDVLIGIDVRPATGQLYSVATSGNLYRLDASGATYAANLVGNIAVSLTGAGYGFDFNPTVDRLRVVGDTDQNLRINPNDGTLAATDTNLAYAGGDPHAGANPNVVGVAYLNNFAGSTTTALYGIDSTLDQMVVHNPPNNGTLNTLTGPLGFDTDDRVGFDVMTVGSAALYR